MKRELSFEEKLEKVRDFRPIDDVFFEVLAQEPGVCEEIIRTILEDPNIIVDETSIVVQSSKRNLYGRSVRLDALCTLGDGTKCNIEVQRSDNDDHLRRARFNASSITVKDSQPGDRFEVVPNVCIIYISEFDFLGKGKTIYHVEKTIRETGDVVDDGLHEVFVNTAVDDGTLIADLMNCFTKKEVHDAKFPALSKAVTRIKTTEGGSDTMCKTMQIYEDAARQEGRREERIETLMSLFSQGGTEEQARVLLKYSDEDIQAAKEKMQE